MLKIDISTAYLYEFHSLHIQHVYNIQKVQSTESTRARISVIKLAHGQFSGASQQTEGAVQDIRGRGCALPGLLTATRHQ